MEAVSPLLLRCPSLLANGVLGAAAARYVRVCKIIPKARRPSPVRCGALRLRCAALRANGRARAPPAAVAAAVRRPAVFGAERRRRRAEREVSASWAELTGF
jgi:hypothetical protein